MVVSGGVLYTEGLEENVQGLFCYEDDGTVFRKRITAVRYLSFKGMAKVCRGGGLEDENMPQWSEKVIGQICNQVLGDVEARNVHTTNIRWLSTKFLRHVIGETEERGAITLSYVCEHCKLFPMEDFLCRAPPTMEKDAAQEQCEWLVVWSVGATV